jgi:hypothetical protein
VLAKVLTNKKSLTQFLTVILTGEGVPVQGIIRFGYVEFIEGKHGLFRRECSDRKEAPP